MIKIYGRPECSNCQKTKRILEARNCEYEWINVDEDPELLQWIRENGFTPLPMIEANGKRWNGLDINRLNAYVQSQM